MVEVKMKILWISANGDRYNIEAEDMNDAKAQIIELRKQLDLPEPTMMVASAKDPSVLKGQNVVDLNSLDEATKKSILEAVDESWLPVDPKTLN
jgi:hypothetical protein